MINGILYINPVQIFLQVSLCPLSDMFMFCLIMFFSPVLFLLMLKHPDLELNITNVLYLLIISSMSKIHVDGTASGLNAEDLKASADSLKLLAETCDADVVLLREKPAEEGTVAEYLVRVRADENDFMEVR